MGRQIFAGEHGGDDRGSTVDREDVVGSHDPLAAQPGNPLAALNDRPYPRRVVLDLRSEHLDRAGLPQGYDLAVVNNAGVTLGEDRAHEVPTVQGVTE